METFFNYLNKKGMAEKTIRKTENAIQNFSEWLKTKHVKIQKANYETMKDYVQYCHEQQNSVHTIRLKIKNLEHYFDYLMESKQMTQNPAKLLKIKGGTQKIPNNLLSKEELEEIYQLQETYGIIQKRNKVILSLIVFQGIGRGELAKIELSDVDLQEGTIRIPAIRTTNERTLPLEIKQLLLFQDYILNIRPVLLAEANKQSNFFIVSAVSGKQFLGNVVSIITKKLRIHYPKLKSMQQIRQSVITGWIKQHGLRKAQYMAGHRYVSSTERYNEERLDGLKKELDRYHLLK